MRPTRLLGPRLRLALAILMAAAAASALRRPRRPADLALTTVTNLPDVVALRNPGDGTAAPLPGAAAGHHPGLRPEDRHPARPPLPRHPGSGRRQRQRAGPARPGLPSRLRKQRLLLRQLHPRPRSPGSTAPRSSASTSRATPTWPTSTSVFTMLEINQDFDNHNGGDVHFGPDGYLYIGMGDGGSGDDPNNRGQDPTQLLGKMLRIDVDNIPTARTAASASAPEERRERHRRPLRPGRRTTASRPAIPSPATPTPATRSGRSACATPSASPSTARPATC